MTALDLSAFLAACFGQITQPRQRLTKGRTKLFSILAAVGNRDFGVLLYHNTLRSQYWLRTTAYASVFLAFFTENNDIGVGCGFLATTGNHPLRWPVAPPIDNRAWQVCSR